MEKIKVENIKDVLIKDLSYEDVEKMAEAGIDPLTVEGNDIASTGIAMAKAGRWITKNLYPEYDFSGQKASDVLRLGIETYQKHFGDAVQSKNS